jgi:hypothetical protein
VASQKPQSLHSGEILAVPLPYEKDVLTINKESIDVLSFFDYQNIWI